MQPIKSLHLPIQGLARYCLLSMTWTVDSLSQFIRASPYLTDTEFGLLHQHCGGQTLTIPPAGQLYYFKEQLSYRPESNWDYQNENLMALPLADGTISSIQTTNK